MAAADLPNTKRLRRVGAVAAAVGDMLPHVSLPATSGRNVDLAAEAQDRHLVLFFYPGDRDGIRYSQLSGCTTEACSFREQHWKIRALGAAIFGVSTGTIARQRAFVDREELTFELLSDPRRELIDALGIPLWRSDEGEKFVSRTTVVVRPGARIATIFENVSVPAHLDAVVSAIRSLDP